jgi:hypothetical protein
MRLGLAFKAFFRVLRDLSFAEQVDRLVQGQTPAAPSASAPALADKPVSETVSKAPTRSEALTLLATLQREARLIDFIKEDLSGYDDAQVGAAVRDIHRDCAAVLERMFALRPLHEQQEGAQVEIAAGFNPGRMKLTGHVSGQPPFRGMLTHQGWQATRCNLPEWVGQNDVARVIAPTEVEVS